MKKFDMFKRIQLFIFIILASFALFSILTDSHLYQLGATNSHIRLLCILLWIGYGLSFLFMFIDFTFFSIFKREYLELDFAVHSDPLSGIANRNSCDAIIEKYLNKPLPATVGCVMFDLSNIREINKKMGYFYGNALIREFSDILHSSSFRLCFVCRNGGNKFLAIFEECSEERLQQFINTVNEKIKHYNNLNTTLPMEHNYGIAFHEGASVKIITDLIALANRRIYENATLPYE